MALRDLLVKFGVEVDGQQQLATTDAALRRTLLNAQRLGNTFRRLAGYLLVGGIVTGIKNFVEGQIAAADALKHNAEKLGISTEELQKYQYAATQMGISTQETSVAMRFFNRAVGEASLGTKSAVKVFAGLGIKVRDAGGQVRPTNELLFEFADKLQTIPSQAQRTAYAMRTLGRGGSALLPVLQKGSAGLKEIFKDVDELGGGFNDAFIQAAHDTDVQLKRLKMGWRSVYVALSMELIPVLKRWTERSIKTVKYLIDLSKHTYAFRTALMALASGTVIFALKRLFGLFNPFKTSIKDVMMALLANAPLVIFVALCVTAYFALDDLYAFLNGKGSILGDFLDKIGGKGTSQQFLKDLKKDFEDIWAAVQPVLPQMTDLGKRILIAFGESIPYILKWGGVFTTFVISQLEDAYHILTDFSIRVKEVFALIEAFKHGKSMVAILEKGSDDHEAELTRHNAFQNTLAAAARTFDTIGAGITPSKYGSSSTINPDGSIAGLPPPPAPRGYGGHGGAAPITVQVTNNISGAASPQATAVAVSSATTRTVKDTLSRHRDAHAAVTAGMPTSGL